MLSVKNRRIIWDLTYACPLRCIHCYSESGRRSNASLDEEEMLKAAKIIVNAQPVRVSISGGEPLVVPWWRKALRVLKEAEIPTTVFSSGWHMTKPIASDLNDLASSVAISVDGANPMSHDKIRGRLGSFEKVCQSLGLLHKEKERRLSLGLGHCTIGVDFTVTKPTLLEVTDFVSKFSQEFPLLDFIRIGAVVPEGLAQEETFSKTFLLNENEVEALSGSADELRKHCTGKARVEVTDARYFLPTSELSDESAMIAHIEPDGQLRAFTTYEAKVGNILEEDFEELWERALAWRDLPLVRSLRGSITTVDEWAQVTRILDRTFGSVDDRIRIARRS